MYLGKDRQVCCKEQIKEELWQKRQSVFYLHLLIRPVV
jgi:hypothetical protein